MLSRLNRAFAAATIALTGVLVTPSAVDAAPPGAPATAAATPDPLYLQVVAHQDDDLFFLNPDLDDTIRAGLPSVTVYLTAGQITGNGDSDEQRARNRQRGVQNAYATMAGVSDGDETTQLEWQGTPWRVADRTVELYALRARPDVRLVFLNLHDASLADVDAGGVDDTVVPAGGLVTGSVRYTRAQLVQTLTAVMTALRPTVLRTQDPEPERLEGYRADHPDHVAGARFAREAAAAYPQPFVEVAYRGYNIADVPQNLSPAQVARKTDILLRYSRFDTEARDSGPFWLNRMHRRWPLGTGWVTRDAAELLQAFVVLNGRAYAHQQEPGGTWTGPRPLASAGGRLAPGLTVVRDAGRRLHLFARRLSDHRIVMLSQDRAGGTFGSTWTDLGSPSAGLGTADLLGTPTVAANADGRLQVFVTNGGGGLSTLPQTAAGGSWSRTWLDLGGEDLQDGLSAVTGPEGRIEVFAATRQAVIRWVQNRPNGDVQRDPVLRSSLAPASPPQAVADRLGRIAISFRRAGNGNLLVMPQSTVGGTWMSPIDLQGPGTDEASTVLSPAGPDGRIMLFARTSRGGVAVSRQTGTGNSFSQWSDLGGTAAGAPAAVLDSSSRVVVLTVGATGLAVRQQTAAGPDQPFGPWLNLGL